MEKKSTIAEAASSVSYEVMEAHARRVGADRFKRDFDIAVPGFGFDHFTALHLVGGFDLDPHSLERGPGCGSHFRDRHGKSLVRVAAHAVGDTRRCTDTEAGQRYGSTAACQENKSQGGDDENSIGMHGNPLYAGHGEAGGLQILAGSLAASDCVFLFYIGHPIDGHAEDRD